MKKLIVAIDGPAGSGKSSTARAVAERLGYIYIDTGAMYRAVTLALLRAGVTLDAVGAAAVLPGINIELQPGEEGQRTFLNGEDVSEEIRTPQVTTRVSTVAALPEVRKALVEKQRAIGTGGGIVMDGRDIGTNVFPAADLKVFMVAGSAERARRRKLEMNARGVEVDLAELQRQIEARDREDSERDIAPLRKAPDAVEIDTSNCDFDEQVEQVLVLVNARR